MCGILGYVNTSLNKEIIEQLTKKIAHRGPDNQTTKEYKFLGNNLFFSHARLSIQDLAEHANQPMENDRFVMIFNGEIYNHFNIRENLKFDNFKTRSDTETILWAFTELGIKNALQQFVGMFAIALFDKLEQKIYLIRDRVGIKPLYWTLQNGEFAFGSELKVFAEHLKTDKNSKALAQFITGGYIFDEYSYYENIHKLKPAHYLEYDGKNIKTKQYWELPKESIDITFEEAVEETERLIRQSVKLRLLADVEVGSFLSGGVDSSLISAMMQQESQKPIKTFSIGFDDKRYDESLYAKDVANHIGSEHYEYKFQPKDVLDLIESSNYYFDEPFSDISLLPMMILSKITKNEVTVALSGDGGDELFLGYDRYFFANDYFKKLSKIPYPIRSILSYAMEYSKIDKLEKMSYPVKNLNIENLFSILFTNMKPWNISKVFKSDFIKELYGTDHPSLLDIFEFNFDGRDSFDSLSRLDFYRYLPDDILTKVDRASMAYSLEARVPILDHNVVEFAYSLPTTIKLQKGRKGILKEVLYKHVPKELIERPKRGFYVPFKHWFRDELKDILMSKIDSLDVRFNKEYISKIANLHIYHNRNYEYFLWSIMRL